MELKIMQQFFSVLQSTRDATGAAIAVFTANKHFPTQTSHQTTLQGLVYQLDVALQSVETQRAGLVFIYDMTDSKYTNFDYELSQKILTMLKRGSSPSDDFKYRKENTSTDFSRQIVPEHNCLKGEKTTEELRVTKREYQTVTKAGSKVGMLE
ncbi:jg14763 [Pararge aegeria aegeria]|uniref:Jg14763 protein n=1 Tax=Pararge aegeria aegeria TaxID=348720 RepID=A0A8S4SKS4_9NEOP|nr:jg14763 [Pararge aegeria aegeria]